MFVALPQDGPAAEAWTLVDSVHRQEPCTAVEC